MLNTSIYKIFLIQSHRFRMVTLIGITFLVCELDIWIIKAKTASANLSVHRKNQGHNPLT